MSSRDNTRQNAGQTQAEATNGAIDGSAGPAQARQFVNEFLAKGRDVANRLESVNPARGDALDRQAETIAQNLRQIELLIESGGNQQKISRSIIETTRMINDAERELNPGPATANPSGISERPSNDPRYATEFTLSVKHGEPIGFTWKRLITDETYGGQRFTNCIANVTIPQVFEGNTKSMDDPTLGHVVRTRDPKNPDRDIITIQVSNLIRGYVTLHHGGHQTHLNVQNRHDNHHLWNSDGAAPQVDAQAVARAAGAIHSAVTSQRAAPVAMPAEGTKLQGGTETSINAGQQVIYFRYQGRTHKFEPGMTQSLTIGEVSFSVNEGQFKIEVGENAAAGPVDLRVGQQVRHLAVAERPARATGPEFGEMLPFTRDRCATPVLIEPDATIEILQNGVPVVNSRGVSPGIKRDTDEASARGLKIERFDSRGLAMISADFSTAELAQGRYAVVSRRPGEAPRHHFNFKVEGP